MMKQLDGKLLASIKAIYSKRTIVGPELAFEIKSKRHKVPFAQLNRL